MDDIQERLEHYEGKDRERKEREAEIMRIDLQLFVYARKQRYTLGDKFYRKFALRNAMILDYGKTYGTEAQERLRELLGRNPNVKYCVIAAASAELGEAIRNLVKSYGFTAKQIFSSYAEAQAAAQADRTITHLFASLEKALTDEDKALNPDGLYIIETQAPTVRQVVDGFTIYLRNMGAYDTITQK